MVGWLILHCIHSYYYYYYVSVYTHYYIKKALAFLTYPMSSHAVFQPQNLSLLHHALYAIAHGHVLLRGPQS